MKRIFVLIVLSVVYDLIQSAPTSQGNGNELSTIKLTTTSGTSCGGYFVFVQICKNGKCCEDEIVNNSDPTNPSGFSGGDILEAKLKTCSDLISCPDKDQNDLKLKLKSFNDIQKNSVEGFCPSKLEIESFLDVKLEAEFANKRVSETPETKLNIIGNVPEACPYLYNSNIQEPKQPNQIISNFTGNLPIHFAAQNGQLNVIKYLINQQGSGINPRNRYGFTPLHLAAENGHLDVVKFLLNNGIDRNPKNYFGSTPLDVAELSGHLEVINFLKKYSEKQAGPKPQKNEGNSPLHWAAINGHLSVVKHLMKAGNNIEQINSNGDTPLHLAALNGRLEIVKFLTNQNINKQPRNNNDQTPLDLAELNGKQEVKNFLDEFYKIGNLMDEFFVYNNQPKNYVIGNSFMHWGASKGHLEVVKYAMKYGDRKEPRNLRGETALHIAAKNGQLEIVKFLMDQTIIDKEPKNNKGETPLDLAKENGHEDIVKFMEEIENNNFSTNTQIPMELNDQPEDPKVASARGFPTSINEATIPQLRLILNKVKTKLDEIEQEKSETETNEEDLEVN